jgi:AraC-like DNA-binding protein
MGHLSSMDEVKQIGLEAFINHFNPMEIFENQVIVMEMSGEDSGKIGQINKTSIFPFQLDAFSAILVCKGELNLTIDYRSYILQPGMVLERSNIHLINDIRMSHDFLGYQIVLGEKMATSLFDELVALPKEFAISKRDNPVQTLERTEFQLLLDILERLRRNLRQKDHFFYKSMILNEVRNFIMELFNIGIQKTHAVPTEISYIEDLVLRFMKLLATRGKEWYEVSDYSTELCVTPVYLSRTVKAINNRSAIEWIHEARIAESKILLRNPNYTVQDVSDLLHFSDQSAFGKFFKKRTGMSPLEYKKSLL